MQVLESIYTEINGVYYINKPYDEYLLVSSAKKIVVSEGLNIKLIDNNIENDLEIEIKQDSYVKYLSVETSNSNLLVNNYGELEYVRISLLENETNLTINLNKEYNVRYAKSTR